MNSIYLITYPSDKEAEALDYLGICEKPFFDQLIQIHGREMPIRRRESYRNLLIGVLVSFLLFPVLERVWGNNFGIASTVFTVFIIQSLLNTFSTYDYNQELEHIRTNTKVIPIPVIDFSLPNNGYSIWDKDFFEKVSQQHQSFYIIPKESYQKYIDSLIQLQKQISHNQKFDFIEKSIQAIHVADRQNKKLLVTTNFTLE